MNRNKVMVWQTKLIKTILALQPLFPVPIYFSVLIGKPPLWLSMIIAVLPLGIRYLHTRHIITKTIFDIPILIFICGTLLGLIASPIKVVATGTVSSTIASILIYYGFTSNCSASKKYWQGTAVIICLITLLLSLWFLSQSDHRILFFNQWAFNLFSRLPKTTGPVLQLNTIGALLSVVIPSLFVFMFCKNSVCMRVVTLILWLLFTGILFLSDSGAGWLAVAISLTFILIYWRWRLLWVGVPMIGILTTVAVIFYDKTEWLKISFSTGSLINRINLWRNTITLLKGKAAVIGLGPGAWLSVYNSHFTNSLPIVHNSYLQLYCDTGVLGFGAAVLAFIIFIRFSIHILKLFPRNSVSWIGIGLIGSIIAGAIFAFFDTTYTITDVTKNGYIYLSIPLLWIYASAVAVIKMKNDS